MNYGSQRYQTIFNPKAQRRTPFLVLWNWFHPWCSRWHFVEKVLIYLDLDDINKLFQILPYEQIRKSWRDNLIPLGERYYSLNRFLALYYFNVKRPGAYVKSIITRHLNKLAKWFHSTFALSYINFYSIAQKSHCVL